MTIHQTTLTIPITDLPPSVQAALAAGQRVDVTSGPARVGLLVPIEPATLAPAEALAAIEQVLARADAAGHDEVLRQALSQDEAE